MQCLLYMKTCEHLWYYLAQFPYLHLILYVTVNKFLSSVTLSAVCCFMSGHLLFSSSSLWTPLWFVYCTLFNCYSVLWNLFCNAVQHTFTGKLQKSEVQQNVTNSRQLYHTTNCTLYGVLTYTTYVVIKVVCLHW